MITEYRPVSWGEGEPLSAHKLATMASNDQYLFESLPRLFFSNGGIKKDKGIKVFATTAVVAPQSSRHGRATVYFGDIFSVGCKPVINLTVNASPYEQFNLAIKGIGTLIPDHRGVEVLASADELEIKHNNIKANIYLNVIAIGF